MLLLCSEIFSSTDPHQSMQTNLAHKCVNATLIKYSHPAPTRFFIRYFLLGSSFDTSFSTYQ